jgi:hypothetical protein
MATLEEKQAYYEYDPRQAGRWWRKDPPAEEPWFNQELVDLAGLEDGKHPRLRAVWGATAMDDKTYRRQLKYRAVRSITSGYHYLRTNGETGFCKSMTEAEDPLVPWKFQPVRERIEFGRLRWIIEKHMSAEECRRLGRFQNLKSPDGEQILRELPSEGVYDPWFVVQTARHKYRDLDREVLTAVQAMWLYNLNTSETQKALDAMEYDRQQTLIGAEEAREVWAEMNRR